MKQLLAVPYEEYTSSNSHNGVKYDIVDNDGRVYLRCVVTTRKYADHDLVIKELAEAPSSVRVAIQSHFNDEFGKEKWKVVTRLPFNASSLFHERVRRVVQPNAIEVQFNPLDNEVKRHQIQN